MTETPIAPIGRLRLWITAAILVCTAACATDEPELTGFGLGDTRIVSLGDVVELRTPLRPDGTAQWRVVAYDSLHLAMVGTPSVETRSNGRRELVVYARARTIGDTRVELVEVAPPAGRAARTKSFDVKIRE